MAAADQLTSILTLLNSGKGGTTKQTSTASGGTQTQQTQLSDEAVQEQIRRILSGAGGVQSVGGAARRSGLYNSTTEDMLLGNLYATAAAQGEIARAPIVTSTTPVTTISESKAPKGAGIQDAILPILAMGAISKGFDMLPGMLGGLMGGGSDSKGVPHIDPLLDGESSLSFGANPGGGFNLGGRLGSGTGWDGDVSRTSATLGQFNDGMGAIGASGSPTKKGEGGFDLVGAAGSALSGLFGGGGLGGLLGGLTGGFGGSGGGSKTSGGSVICTALQEIRELDEALYAKGSAYLNQLDPLTVIGYQVWAIKVADKIRQGSWLAKAVCRPIARSRTALLATDGSFLSHLKYPLGTLTKYVGEPVCRAIGWTLIQLALIEAAGAIGKDHYSN